MDDSTSEGDLLKMLNFNTALNLYNNDRISELAGTDDGMRFLKLRSLSRKKYLEYLIDKFQLKMGDLTSRQWLQPIYESTIQSEDIDDVLPP